MELSSSRSLTTFYVENIVRFGDTEKKIGALLRENFKTSLREMDVSVLITE